LRAAAEAYAAARNRYAAARRQAEAAYERLEAAPRTIEYRIEWNVLRLREAAAAAMLREARDAYRQVGGYIGEGEEWTT